MEKSPFRFVIVIHPPNYDAADLVIILMRSGVTALHVMPYERWTESGSNHDYDWIFVRPDGNWLYMSKSDDRRSIAVEIGAQKAFAEIGKR